MANTHNIKVGDKLFVVWRVWSYRRDQPEHVDTVEITRVGRKYAYFVKGRSMGEVDVDLETLSVGKSTTGRDSAGKAHLDEAVYRTKQTLSACRNNLKREVVNLRFPADWEPSVTAENILEAARLLGIPPEKILPPTAPIRTAP